MNEKHNEQNQQKWLSRAKRERINLSASVEEALEDPIVDEPYWSEEEDEQSEFPQRLQGNGVFPPRLSLQSRPVPAVPPDRRTPLSSYTSPEQERKQTQNTSMLRRFAQRLTSSFAALGGVPQSEIVESSLPPPQQEERPSREHEDIQPAFLSADVPQERSVFQTLEHPGNDELRERQGKQRLAGRTTRIHLETPPASAQGRPRQSEGGQAEKIYHDVAQKRIPTTENELARRIENDSIGGISQQARVNAPAMMSLTNSSVLTAEQVPARISSTGVRLSAVEAHKEKVGAPTRRELSGSGLFEAGQGDAIVVNRYVTEASVVLVTLTTNPGPVVIQYVTLRPRIGFTVHLTAPATMRASFNYIVLLGELF